MVTNHTKTEENNEDRYILSSGVPRGVLGGKALQNRAKFNPIVKTVKNC
jgi:hypothetical protein